MYIKCPRTFVGTNRGSFYQSSHFREHISMSAKFAYNEFFFNSYLKITSINLDNGFFQPKLLFSDYDLKQKIVQSARN